MLGSHVPKTIISRLGLPKIVSYIEVELREPGRESMNFKEENRSWWCIEAGMVMAFSKNRKDSGQITAEGSDTKWRRRGLGYEGWGHIMEKLGTWQKSSHLRNWEATELLAGESWIGGDGAGEWEINAIKKK